MRLWPPFDPISPSWAYGQRVKMQDLESIKDLFRHKNSLGFHFGHMWLMHFRCASGFSRICQTFFGWGFISKHGTYQWSSSFRRHHVALGILSSCVVCQPSYLTWTTFSFFFLVFFGEFRHENYVGMWGHNGSKIMGVFSRPLTRCQARLPISFASIGLFSMDDCASISFSKKLGFSGFVFMF